MLRIVEEEDVAPGAYHTAITIIVHFSIRRHSNVPPKSYGAGLWRRYRNEVVGPQHTSR